MFIIRLFQWFIYLPIALCIQLIKYPLIPFIVLLFSTSDRKHLTFCKWLETLDNDLGGDAGWKTEHISPGSDPYSTWNRIKWLWRNGGNAFNYSIIGINNDEILPEFKKGLTIRKDGYWLYRNHFKISSSKSLELFWGWGLYGVIEGKNKFTFTTRVKLTNQLGY